MRWRMSPRVRGRGVSIRAATRLTSRSSRSIALERRDELLDPLVPGLERVLAEHRPLGLVVELEMDPVHGEVTAAFLGPPDELAPELGPGGLRRLIDGRLDLLVGARAFDEVAVLHFVKEPPVATDVVILEVHQRDLRVGQGNAFPPAIMLDQAVLDHP